MKHYAKAAVVYAVLAMAGGVFYREFTKFYAFTQKTTLSVVHAHYLLLGVLFPLLFLLLQKAFSFAGKHTGKALVLYHVGLNITCVMLLVRGVFQVMQTPLSTAVNASISGVAGIGHILLGGGFIWLLVQILHSVQAAEKVTNQ